MYIKSLKYIKIQMCENVWEMSTEFPNSVNLDMWGMYMCSDIFLLV